MVSYPDLIPEGALHRRQDSKKKKEGAIKLKIVCLSPPEPSPLV